MNGRVLRCLCVCAALAGAVAWWNSPRVITRGWRSVLVSRVEQVDDITIATVEFGPLSCRAPIGKGVGEAKELEGRLLAVWVCVTQAEDGTTTLSVDEADFINSALECVTRERFMKR